MPPLRCHAVHHPVYWWAVVPLIACNIVKRMTQARIRRQDAAESTGPVALLDLADVGFAHPSEAEFARILDFYRITWQYEPHTFTLRWHDDGSPAERFTPDFYLPELDLYVELTTLKQSLVTRKNRKMRRLKELYPDVKIKLLYGRDYRSLLFKYGLNPQATAAAGTPPPDGGSTDAE